MPRTSSPLYTVTVSELNGDNVLHTERHTTTVSGPEAITVAGGSFDAFLVNWSRTTTDAAGAVTVENALLRLAPDVGVVKHEAFDGTVLELTATP